jgi:hypothetical protein
VDTSAAREWEKEVDMPQQESASLMMQREVVITDSLAVINHLKA